MSTRLYSASTVARWFLAWADGEEEAVLSNLKLQKLLYYAQGHHLARHHAPLFGDEIQAWSHGPVVPTVYHEYKRFGGGPITREDDDFSFGDVDKATTKFLVAVWNTFGSKSAWRLRDMTHSEKPWTSTFKEGRRNLEITQASMEDYFAGLYEKRKRKK